MKLLVDGDVIAYRCGFATERTKYLAEYGNGTFANFDDFKAAKATEHLRLWSRKEAEPEDKALMLVDVVLADIRSRYDAMREDTQLYLSGPFNFRHLVATRAAYKGGRGERPKHLPAIRDHLIAQHNAKVSDWKEADDDIADAWYAEPDSTIVTIDKDFDQLPARIYNFVTREERNISKKEASINFYAQIISGDPTDAIPGLTGYGPVKAKKALADCNGSAQCWERVLSLYYNEFTETHGERYALETARLIKIGQQSRDNLWLPPSQVRQQPYSRSKAG